MKALKSTRALTAVAVAMLAIFITVGAIATIATARSLSRSTYWVQHTLEVRDLMRRAATSLAEAESANRGFLIAEEATYLQPMDDAEREFPVIRQRLIELTADNAAQQDRIIAMFSDIERKLAIMRSMQQVATQKSFAEAKAVFDVDRGLTVTRRIVAASDIIIAEEENILRARQDEEAALRVSFFALLVALLAATIILAVVAFITARRQLRQAETEKDSANLLNVELEERVRERTADLEIARGHAESEAARAERERHRVELLLRDLNHRVGNNLSMVSALLGMQAMRTDNETAKTALNSARERVFMIGSAQRRLRLSEDMQSTLAKNLFTEVVNDIVEAWPEEIELTVRHDYEELVLDQRDAVTLAVVLGELVTNALKHAFEGRDRGSIVAAFSRNDSGVFVLGVSDDGVGLSEGGRPEGIGSTVINEMSKQFGGQITRGKGPKGGALISVTLPHLRPFEENSENA